MILIQVSRQDYIQICVQGITMPSPIVQSVSGYVIMGAVAVYEYLRFVAQAAPRTWYYWRASHHTLLLEMQGQNSGTECGCGALKIKARLEASYPWSENPFQICQRLCRFKPPQHVNLESRCPLCRLLASSIQAPASEVQIPSLTLYKLGHTRTLKGELAGVWSFEADVPEVRSILPLGEDAYLLGKLPDSHARCLQQNHASRQCIIEWVRRCSYDHPRCQALEEQVRMRSQGPKRLINTRCMSIELISRPVRYLALSYVWGNHPQPRIHDLGKMSAASWSIGIHHMSLPRVIEDAIQLTNELGETYLWVDALCINQDDVEEKAVEIARMNEIYLAAIMTIVALDSDNADSGLPGVRPYNAPRALKIETIEGIRCTTVHPSLREKYAKPECKWNTRAWTFQEHLFSRRLVFLGSHQAYFSCLTANYAEDRYESDETDYKLHSHPGKFLLDPPPGLSLWKWRVWKRYAELHSMRFTSVETDRYLAFQGVLSEQEKAWNMVFAEALPIDFLPLALYWWHGPARGELSDPMPHRIEGRPSWTWTGWSGPVSFPDYNRYRSVIATIEVLSDAGSTMYEYSVNGTLQSNPTETNETFGVSPTVRLTSNYPQNPVNRRTNSDQADVHSSIALSFEGQCVSVDAIADNYRPSYLSVRDESGIRLGGLSHTTASPSCTNNAATIICTCVLLGISWSPIGFLWYVEDVIGWMAEKKGFDVDIDEILAPVNTRYEERAHQRQTATFKVGRANGKFFSKHVWVTRMVLTACIVALSVLFVTIMSTISLLMLPLFIFTLAIMVVFYGFYFCCMRPLWIWSDSRRVAHVLWIEEVSPGVYQRIGVGEIYYSAFKNLTPQLKKIKLV